MDSQLYPRVRDSHINKCYGVSTILHLASKCEGLNGEASRGVFESLPQGCQRSNANSKC
jgi:hypothetical protein